MLFISNLLHRKKLTSALFIIDYLLENIASVAMTSYKRRRYISFFLLFTDCGGMVEVPPGNDVFVISPGYPASYPPGKTCRWGVKV